MDQNKIILLSNIKGGVGKTSLCGMLATYMAMQGLPVIVVDADLQQSLCRHRQRESKAYPDVKVPWQVATLDTSNVENVKRAVEKLKGVAGYVLVDCPGYMNEQGLVPLFKAADCVVIPMAYDQDTVDATGVFIKVFRKINQNAKLLFLPNRINASEGNRVEMEQRKQTIEILGKVGRVLPRIKQSVIVKRYNTIYPLDSYQSNLVKFPFDKIIEEIK